MRNCIAISVSFDVSAGHYHLIYGSPVGQMRPLPLHHVSRGQLIKEKILHFRSHYSIDFCCVHVKLTLSGTNLVLIWFFFRKH